MKKVLVSFKEETLAQLDLVAAKGERSGWIEALVRRSLEAMDAPSPDPVVEKPPVAKAPVKPKTIPVEKASEDAERLKQEKLARARRALASVEKPAAAPKPDPAEDILDDFESEFSREPFFDDWNQPRGRRRK